MRKPVGWSARLRRSTARRLLMVAFGLVVGVIVTVPVLAAERELYPRIVGGEPVPTGSYPFVTSLGDIRDDGTAYRWHFCGASLIDRNSVLTAGHCVQGTPKWPLRVTVGRTVLSSNGGQTRRVSRIVIHPRFSGFSNFEYDTAVLTLKNPVQGIPALRLAGASQDALENPGRLATVAGWGNTIKQPPRGDNGSSYPDRMRVARVPIVSDARARDVFGPSYVGALMVAAGKEGKDACYGDSGGPMFARQDDKRYQIGITSFGRGCGARGYPGVYTEVNARAIRAFIVNAAGL